MNSWFDLFRTFNFCYLIAVKWDFCAVESVNVTNKPRFKSLPIFSVIRNTRVALKLDFTILATESPGPFNFLQPIFYFFWLTLDVKRGQATARGCKRALMARWESTNKAKPPVTCGSTTRRLWMANSVWVTGSNRVDLPPLPHRKGSWDTILDKVV